MKSPPRTCVSLVPRALKPAEQWSWQCVGGWLEIPPLVRLSRPHRYKKLPLTSAPIWLSCISPKAVLCSVPPVSSLLLVRACAPKFAFRGSCLFSPSCVRLSLSFRLSRSPTSPKLSMPPAVGWPLDLIHLVSCWCTFFSLRLCFLGADFSLSRAKPWPSLTTL